MLEFSVRVCFQILSELLHLQLLGFQPSLGLFGTFVCCCLLLYVIVLFVVFSDHFIPDMQHFGVVAVVAPPVETRNILQRSSVNQTRVSGSDPEKEPVWGPTCHCSDCCSRDVSVHTRGCFLLTRLGAASSRQGTFYISPISGARGSDAVLYLDYLDYEVSGPQPKVCSVEMSSDQHTTALLMKPPWTPAGTERSSEHTHHESATDDSE